MDLARLLLLLHERPPAPFTAEVLALALAFCHADEDHIGGYCSLACRYSVLP